MSDNKAMLAAEAALREAHHKHSRDFFNPWEASTKVEPVKPWAAFVKNEGKLMVRTFEKRDEAKDFAKTTRVNVGMFAESEVVRANSTRAKNLFEKVNAVSLTHSPERSNKEKTAGVRPKQEKKESVKKQNYELSL